eukprot:TRINITY_DN49344_c0_g1_i1.p1 TRINITY_DN49344_c0_g1~~TRINITY_DN49344_c0_g1_i1.p1  ORF type:complete len:117 (-),score=10.07 TRINITY_DN49344_c0_g1_i1:75-425(-)
MSLQGSQNSYVQRYPAIHASPGLSLILANIHPKEYACCGVTGLVSYFVGWFGPHQPDWMRPRSAMCAAVVGAFIFLGKYMRDSQFRLKGITKNDREVQKYKYRQDSAIPNSMKATI